jgi:hypothetical protein
MSVLGAPNATGFQQKFAANSRPNPGLTPQLEHLKKHYSRAVKRNERAVFLRFGFVLAQSQVYADMLLRPSLAKTQKSSLRTAIVFL